jgi:hypothetical protein
VCHPDPLVLSVQWQAQHPILDDPHKDSITDSWCEKSEISHPISTSTSNDINDRNDITTKVHGDGATQQIEVGTHVVVVDELSRPGQRPLTVREIRVSAYDEGLWVRLSDGWWRPFRVLRPVGKEQANGLNGSVPRSSPSIMVGDLVNAATTNGDLVTATPRRVVSVEEHKGTLWVHLEETDTGWPADQIELVARHAAFEEGRA